MWAFSAPVADASHASATGPPLPRPPWPAARDVSGPEGQLPRYSPMVRDLLDAPLHLALPRPVGAPDARRPTAALRSLADHPRVMEHKGTTARHRAIVLGRGAGLEPDVRFQTTDLLPHRHLVEQGHATAFLPDLVRSGQAPTVPLRAPSPTSGAHAPHLHGRTD